MRAGIFGGAFNPPHNGHLTCAREALRQLDLGEVMLVPTGQAPHKPIEADPGAQTRLEMTRLAALDEDRLEISSIEVELEEPSYTWLTLERLAEQRPNDELVLILGADQAAAFGEWREPARVAKLARLAVADRTGTDREAVAEAIETAAAGSAPTFFEMPRVDISSSMVRERVAAGDSIRDLVPDRVADFIEREGLYLGSVR